MLKTKNMKHILKNRSRSRLVVLMLAASLIIAGAGYPGHASADTSVPIGSGYTLTASSPAISGSTITGKATLSGTASTSEQVQACLWYPSNDSWTQGSGSCKTVTQTAAST